MSDMPPYVYPGTPLHRSAFRRVEQEHVTTETVATKELTPPHPPREDTPEYRKTHHHLIDVLDSPCMVCGVRKSTLADQAQNPCGARDLETHHAPIERSLLSACDPRKVGKRYPQVSDLASLEAFVDSEHNMYVLCDIHHRDPERGIHHLLVQDFLIQPFLYDGYQVAATETDAQAVARADSLLLQKETPDDPCANP